jgi:hypothetical protein
VKGRRNLPDALEVDDPGTRTALAIESAKRRWQVRQRRDDKPADDGLMTRRWVRPLGAPLGQSSFTAGPRSAWGCGPRGIAQPPGPRPDADELQADAPDPMVRTTATSTRMAIPPGCMSSRCWPGEIGLGLDRQAGLGEIAHPAGLAAGLQPQDGPQVHGPALVPAALLAYADIAVPPPEGEETPEACAAAERVNVDDAGQALEQTITGEFGFASTAGAVGFPHFRAYLSGWEV